MAEINLGNIKFNWRGAYAGGTAYVVDDVVSSAGSSYVCILASTGNTPPNGTYWNLMAQGGTGSAATLTTTGDMLYRDGSGLQRLGIGTAGQELKVNSGASAPEWYTPAVASSDYVLLHTTAVMSGTTIIVDNIFNSTYNSYRVDISGFYPSADAIGEFRFRSGGASGVTESDASYSYSHWRVEQQFVGGSASGSALTANATNNTLAAWTQSTESGNANKVANTTINIYNATPNNATYFTNHSIGVDGSGAWIANLIGGGVYYKAQVITGLAFSTSAGTTTAGVLKIYGLK